MSPGEEHVRAIQLALSQRVKDRATCSACDTKPFVASLREPNGPPGYEPMTHFAGYVKRCATCASKPVETFAWIADIPFEKFHTFYLQNQGAPFALDALKSLLPPSAADEGGFKYL